MNLRPHPGPLPQEREKHAPRFGETTHGRFIHAVVLLMLFSLNAWANDTITNIMSPVVSYQYQDNIGASVTTNGGVMSPIVSYQYYDWVGDDVAKIQNSSPVSYFYQGGPISASIAFRGRVIDPNGQLVADVLVEASVMKLPVASVTTDKDGYYVLPELSAGTYELRAVKAGWLSDCRTIGLTTPRMEQNFQLKPLAPPPSLNVAESTPAFIPPPDGAQGSRLRIFNGTTFSDDLTSLDRTRMTIVMTHGWIPFPETDGASPLDGGWPLILAEKIKDLGLLPHVNIVAWDWQSTAKAPLPPEEATPQQGVALGRELQNQLGEDYQQKVHFIGHSLGTLLNGYAVDYLHGYKRAGCVAAVHPWQASSTHVTMSDEASISRLIAKQTLIELASCGIKSYVSSVALGWKNPVPHDFLWMDNYISSVGRYHPETVNILLQKGMLFALADQSWFDAAVKAHSYPMETWYPKTVISQNRMMPGFGASFEYQILKSDADFPPAGLGFVPGIAYRQSESPGDELVLEYVTDLYERLFYPAMSTVLAYSPEAAAEIAKYVSNYVETRLDQVGASGQRFGDVLVEMGQDVVVGLDAAVDRVINGTDATWDGLVDMLNRPNLRIQLHTGLPPIISGLRQPKDTITEKNTPAGIWLSVMLPTNASALAFDFVLEGDGKDDSLVFSVNGTNLFTLATKFIPTTITNTSRIIDIGGMAGTTNELFFGILGGTSTNCTIRIEKIGIVTYQPQSLSFSKNTNGTTTLSWASTINGYVLETIADLNSNAWTTVTNSPTLFGGRYNVTNQWPDQTRFFRLRAR